MADAKGRKATARGSMDMLLRNGAVITRLAVTASRPILTECRRFPDDLGGGTH
jgi:hypothetical protein